ncbi:hypothetical protein TRFO_13324 [Tritrichomonas foetus]|uniref:DUF4201 domain-containing protein n=1 Tax=Tritrichomonas foetus TaxID=1144522 RepID=A0A1J4L315_9EUKA|nr:hypothetical protein TRFO_13324 [Tritrichomonas foetus]|eukprot:OHT16309.1 hypothetical protein TRFO_13324 [Tritrichomonas foetus]
MRDQIEAKEAEVVRLREALERDNEVDMSKVPDELKRLQRAFDQVQRICAERIAPIQNEFNKQASKHEAKQQYMDAMEEIAKERFEFLHKMNNKADDTTARLEDPVVKPVEETPIFPLSKEAGQLETELANLHRNSLLDSYSEKQFKKLNDEIQRNMKDAEFEEKKEERRVDTAKKDIAVRCNRPKPPKITQEWIDAQKNLTKNQIFLTEVNNAIKLFNDEAQKLVSQNRIQNDKLSTLRDEFASLQRFLPGEDGAFHDKDSMSRSEMTTKSMENDKLNMKLLVQKGKYKIEKSRLESIQEKLKTFPPTIKASQDSLQKTKNRRKEVEIDVENSNLARAELLSHQIFLEDQRNLMKERIAEQRDKLRATYERTKKLKLILKKQQMIIALNDELYALKKMNLERVAGTVSNLLKINSDIDQFQD